MLLLHKKAAKDTVRLLPEEPESQKNKQDARQPNRLPFLFLASGYFGGCSTKQCQKIIFRCRNRLSMASSLIRHLDRGAGGYILRLGGDKGFQALLKNGATPSKGNCLPRTICRRQLDRLRPRSCGEMVAAQRNGALPFQLAMGSG